MLHSESLVPISYSYYEHRYFSELFNKQNLSTHQACCERRGRLPKCRISHSNQVRLLDRTWAWLSFGNVFQTWNSNFYKKYVLQDGYNVLKLKTETQQNKKNSSREKSIKNLVNLHMYYMLLLKAKHCISLLGQNLGQIMQIKLCLKFLMKQN